MRAIPLIACVVALAAACGKQPAQPAPQQTQTAPSPPQPAEQAAQTQPAQTTAAPNPQANIDAVISDLTQRVRKFGVEQMRVPKDLSELVARGYLERIPPAPAGKKFAIDRKMQVYLADE